jgi:hypothetical protein
MNAAHSLPTAALSHVAAARSGSRPDTKECWVLPWNRCIPGALSTRERYVPNSFLTAATARGPFLLLGVDDRQTHPSFEIGEALGSQPRCPLRLDAAPRASKAIRQIMKGRSSSI